MSLRAVLETVIHLESFRNIDLFFQGIYYTRFRIYSKKKNGDANTDRTGKANGAQSAAGDSSAARNNNGSERGGNSAAANASGGANAAADLIEYAQPYCSYVSHYQQEKAAKSAKQGPDHHNLMPA